MYSWNAMKALDEAEMALRWAGRPELLRKVSKLRSRLMHEIAVEGFENPAFKR